MIIFQALFLFLRDLCTNRAALVAENLALRHQLAVPQRSVMPPVPGVRAEQAFR